MNEVLQVKNLSVNLDNEMIINHLSFSVQFGEFLTILGPNGSGKTVLLKALLNLLPYQGEVVWNKKVRLGYLPQGLTQLKFKKLPLLVEEFFWLKKVSLEDIKKYLTLLDLDLAILKKRVGTLSGGQFQRVLMAWVLSSQPNVLLFDEPTTGVDVGAEENIYKLLNKIWQKDKLTIILITHDLNVVSKYSTNVLCLNKGNVCSGQPAEVLSTANLEKIYHNQVKFYQHHH